MLRHDKALHTVRLQSHLKDVPDYIIPPTLRRLAANKNRGRGSASISSSSTVNQGTSQKSRSSSKKERTFLKRKDNPLMSFEFEGFNKKAKKK